MHWLHRRINTLGCPILSHTEHAVSKQTLRTGGLLDIWYRRGYKTSAGTAAQRMKMRGPEEDEPTRGAARVYQ
jgi:hypothetical protein